MRYGWGKQHHLQHKRHDEHKGRLWTLRKRFNSSANAQRTSTPPPDEHPSSF